MSNQEKSIKRFNMIEYLKDCKNVKKFLEELEIDDIVTVEDIQHCTSDDGRERLFIRVQQENLINMTEVYVDFKPGQPSTEQVYEAIYGMGKESQKRVIIFTDEHLTSEGRNPTVDEIAVRSLVESLNECPLNLYLVHLKGAVYGFQLYRIDIIEKPDCGRKLAKVPSPIEFRVEEFWSIYFDWHNEGWYEPWKVFDSGFRSIEDWGHMLWTDPNFAEIPVYWTESGIEYIVEQIENDDDYLKKIWDLKSEELKNRYQGRVAFEFLPGRLPKITVKYSDQPVSWLITATPRERLEFARQLHEDFWGLRWYLSEALEETEDQLVA
jgi:hypothetical protein